MNKYSVYCTEEQTKKALELGAPIETEWYEETMYVGYDRLVIPNTEQMLGWLETIAFQEINIQRFANFWEYSIYLTDDDMVSHNEHYKSRTEATIAAINAALEYLSNEK